MNKKVLLSLGLLFSFTLVGCGENYAGDLDKNDEQNIVTESGNDYVVDTNRKIIYSASYTITDDDISSLQKTVNSKVSELEGYTSSISSYDSRSTIVYYVPTVKFDLFLDYLDTFEGIENKQVSSKDVTSDYSYIQARIETLKASKESYIKLLETAKDIKEVIEITDKIESIDTELTDLAYKKASYDGQIDYSQVTVCFYKTSTYTPPTFFDEYFEFLGDFFVGIGKFILYSLPICLVFFGIFAAIFFPIRAKKKKQENNK